MVVGDNGQGKTNLAEALAYLATLASFRGVGTDALVRVGAAQRGRPRRAPRRRRSAVADRGRDHADRPRPRQVNRQRLARTRDLLGVVRVTVFSPDDLALVKGGPSRAPAVPRRRPGCTGDQVRRDAPRARPHPPATQHAAAPGRRASRRRCRDDARRVGQPSWPRPASSSAARGRRSSSGSTPHVADGLRRSWPATTTSVASTTPRRGGRRGLAAALAAARADDVRRGVSTVGPHRDELELRLAGMPARTHASQGEQRTLALALRLGVHRLVAERTGSTPVLVLDDVLSELDAHRAGACCDMLPAGQIVITTAGTIPPAATPIGSSASPPARSSSHERSVARGGNMAIDDARCGDDGGSDGDPVPLAVARRRRAIAARRGRPQAGAAQAMGGVFGRWDEIVGDAVAAHVQPVRLDGDGWSSRSPIRRGRRRCACSPTGFASGSTRSPAPVDTVEVRVAGRPPRLVGDVADHQPSTVTPRR